MSPSLPQSLQSDTANQRPLRAVDRIRQTARDLFYRLGIRAVGVDAIVTGAGVTKPSLYRSFSSKDDLAAAYMRDYDSDYWKRFDASVAAYPGDPRAQLRHFLTPLAEKAARSGYRGCGLTNAAVEYPLAGQPGGEHPAREIAAANKRELRRRLRQMAADMGAVDPDGLGDGILLMIEGAYVSGQLFGEGGPAATVADNVDRLIEISLGK